METSKADDKDNRIEISEENKREGNYNGKKRKRSKEAEKSD